MRRTFAATLFALVAALGGCKRKHVPVDAVPELGYPSCADAGATDPGTVVARGDIRSGPISNDQNVVERFELRKTACGYKFVSRQEWSANTTDIEVHYDANLTPFWAWKRMTLAASPRPDGDADTRRYELRTGDVFIKRRDPDGAIALERLLPGGRMTVPVGARIGVLIGPGRGILTVWLKRARLKVGGKTDDLVLDIRNPLESLEIGSLERDADRFEPSLARNVRVYTFFGQETVFADDDDVVLGDLSGMRPSESLSTPEPAPLPTFGGPDPVHTP
ncbi:MAG TPA: hypothetical protein VK762_35955 [Polyangiaceae bacterium]|nr:hypothetical protein [Polyangiaceae bacterium]